MTTLIQPKVVLRAADLGIALVTLPEEQGNNTLAQCMKAYRVLDEFELRDIRGLTEDAHVGMVWNARHALACVVAIDMQVDPWLDQARRHLGQLGLRADGLLLGVDDFLPRREMTSQYMSPDGPTIRDTLHTHTSQLPLVFNDFDPDGEEEEFEDIGFASVGGGLLTHLAPMMFLSAQQEKVKGVPWQVVGDQYVSVWLTAGEDLLRPLPLEAALLVLKAYRRCPENANPFQPSELQHGLASNHGSLGQTRIGDPEWIPDIDEDVDIFYMSEFLG